MQVGSKTINDAIMEIEYSESFFLSAGETDAEGELSLPLLTSKLIDIATAHANALGIGNPSMAHLRRGWVLSRLAIEMERYPHVNETYTLTTWVESWNRHFSERNFCISDAEGKPLGYARSIWMVLDTETRESTGLTHLDLSPEIISGRECPIAKQGKHHPILPPDYAGDLPRGAYRATVAPEQYRFKYCDLDFYRHVNTVRYVQMLLNRFPLSFYDRNEIRRMELTFMKESVYGQTVDIFRSEQDDETLFSLNDAQSGEALLFAMLRFAGRGV